jgi:enoyl-CoA hydratase/carnithine racemase
VVHWDIGGDGIATIRLESPDGRNRLGPEVVARLAEAADRAGRSSRALILTGGENFSEGTDPTEVMRFRLDPAEAHRAYRLLAEQKALCDKVRGLSIPTVSLVRGTCQGAALGLAAAAKFMITDATTRIRLPEVALGLVPGNGATWFLPRRMGAAAAKYYALTGRPMTGREAVGLGLAQACAGSDAPELADQLRASGHLADPARIAAHLSARGIDPEALADEVHALRDDLSRHFGFGQANRGYLGDVYTSLETASAKGERFAQEALASMRSNSAQAVWLTEFLIDTFCQEGLYDEDEARALELRFVQEMAAGFAHLEGVLGLVKGSASGGRGSSLDRIVLTDARGFRVAVPATPASTGSRLDRDAAVAYGEVDYVLPRGLYDSGTTRLALARRDAPPETVSFRVALRNSQWSDGEVSDELGVVRSLLETRIGWRVTRRAWLANPEKFELDLSTPTPGARGPRFPSTSRTSP